MALTITWSFGATQYSKTYNVTNAKARAIALRYARHIGISLNQDGVTTPLEEMTDQQIVEALIERGVDEMVRSAKQVQVAEANEANQAAIVAQAELDNSL